MIKTYDWKIQGTAARGQTWVTTGSIDYAMDEFFRLEKVFTEASRQAFEQLTGGRAVYGKPGVGCSGPYDIKRILIKRRNGQ